MKVLTPLTQLLFSILLVLSFFSTTASDTLNIAWMSPSTDTTLLSGANLYMEAEVESATASLKDVQFKVNNFTISVQTKKPFNLQLSGLPVGFNELIAIATDEHGNTDTTDTRIVEVIPREEGLPIIEWVDDSLSVMEINETKSIRFDVVPGLYDISEFAFYFDGELLSANSIGVYEAELTPSQVGSFNVYAVLTDSKGNSVQSSTKIQGVIPDENTPPTVHIQYLDSVSADNHPLFRLVAVDEDGSIKKLRLFIDNNPSGTVFNTAEFIFEITDLNYGLHSAYGMAIDNEGDTAVSDTVSFHLFTAGINELNQQVRVFPNPSPSGNIQIEAEPQAIYVYNNLGLILQVVQHEGAITSHNLNLQPGSYTLRGSKGWTRTLVVQ